MNTTNTTETTTAKNTRKYWVAIFGRGYTGWEHDYWTVSEVADGNS